MFYLYRKYKNNISNYQYYITLDGSNASIQKYFSSKTSISKT